MKSNKDKEITYDLLKAMEDDGYVDSVNYVRARSIEFKRCRERYHITFPKIRRDGIAMFKNCERISTFINVDMLHQYLELFL